MAGNIMVSIEGLQMSYLLITIGGGLGVPFLSVVGQQFPFLFDTMNVNIIWTFIIDLAFVYMAVQFEKRMMLFDMVGILGGFTIFFAFSPDNLKLLDVRKKPYFLSTMSRSVSWLR